MALRVVAISAPHYQTGRIGERVLSGSDPVSLFNACRHAAAAAARRSGVWGESNWNGTRIERRRSMLLLHSLEADVAMFEAALDEVRPHLLLIGAMSLCLPGAIECARRAREMLGDRVAIVLGRSEEHTSELQSLTNLVCRLLLEKKKRNQLHTHSHEYSKPR